MSFGGVESDCETYKNDLEHASLGCFCGGYPHNHLFGLFMYIHSVELQVSRMRLRTLVTRGLSAKRGCRLGSAALCRRSHMARRRHASQGPFTLHQDYREDGRARQGRVHDPGQRLAPQAATQTPAVHRQ